MSIPSVQTRRWSREEYDRLVAEGFFQPGERLQLIEGEIVRMTPQGSAHATAVRLVEDALRRLFEDGFDVRVQMPLAAGSWSEPEPDVAVVPGAPRDYRDAHPSTALLIVEVADATLPHDRDVKARVYAQAGVADYWIVNLVDRQVEVHRDPLPAGEASRYRQRRTFGPSEVISPLARPGAAVPVSDLLP